MLKTLIWLVCIGVSANLAAQTDAAFNVGSPSAEQMIQQLKKPPRTRGFRNLTIEAVPGSAAATNSSAPAPALSLLIEFDFDSDRVRPQSQQVLTLLAQALQSAQLGSSKFLIEGHTDAKGSASYNQKLSLLRAQSVRDFLAGRGVLPERLQVAGKGSSELANSAQPFASENRRVRIVNQD